MTDFFLQCNLQLTKWVHGMLLSLMVSAFKNQFSRDFPGDAVVKNLPANAGDMGSIPGPGRSHMLQSN